MADPVCDICYKSGKGTHIGAAQVREAVLHRGFNPFARNLVPGGPKDTAYFERWKKTVVEADTSDWNLCRNCYQEIRPFFKGDPAPVGIEESSLLNTGDPMLDWALGPLAAAASASKQAEQNRKTEASASKQAEKNHKTEASKCFIATAVCGSADAAEVEALRGWRDRILLKSSAGTLFVGVYYRLSPPLARWIESRPLVRRLIRTLLVGPAARWVRRRQP